MREAAWAGRGIRPTIKGLKFASIPVADQDETLAFYTDRLGFRVVADQPWDDRQRWIEFDWVTAAVFRDQDGNVFVLSSKVMCGPHRVLQLSPFIVRVRNAHA